MENLKKTSAILILITIVLAMSAANTVHALGVTATVTVGNLPGAVAYDSAKGEIFVANGGSNTVSVISDSSVTSSSPSTTIPEFTFTLPILLAIIVVTVSFCAIAVATKNRLETVLIQISGKRKH